MLHATIRMQLDLAVEGPTEACRKGKREGAARGLRDNGLLGALPKQAELILADTAFHAENQTIIRQGEVIDLIEIGDEGVEVPADLEQLGPVLGVAREPGGFEAQDDLDVLRCPRCADRMDCREDETTLSPRPLCLPRKTTSPCSPSLSRSDGEGDRLPVSSVAPWCPGPPASRPLPFDHAHGLWQDRPRRQRALSAPCQAGKETGGD